MEKIAWERVSFIGYLMNLCVGDNPSVRKKKKKVCV